MTKKPARVRKRHDEPFDRLAVAVGDYLESIGWSAVVVGNPRVQQQPDAAQFNFEFVVRFTGGKKKP